MTEGCAERIISLLLNLEARELEPEISYEDGPSFHSALGISKEECPNLNELLESLAEEGLLRRHKVGSLPACPNCGSFRLMVRFTCPVCGSINVRRVDAISHLACGFVAPAEEFGSGDSLRCPKCGRALRALGVDYNRLSRVILCEECGRISLSPKLSFECADCGKQSSEAELSLRAVYKYEVLRERILSRAPVTEEIARILRARGFEVMSPREVLGLSGIVHRFSMSARMGGDEHLVDVVQGEGQVGEDKVLSLFGKMVDSQSTEATLVAIPRASEGAKALARSFNINLIEAESPEDAASKISERLIGPKRRESISLER